MSQFYLQIPENEYEMTAVRASGPGGQHVNKVSTAIQLRFDIRASSLSEIQKEMLLTYRDRRISKEGVVLIHCEAHKSQVKNREAAVERLQVLIRQATQQKKKRKSTKVPRSVKEARLKSKSKRAQIKKLRKKVDRDD